MLSTFIVSFLIPPARWSSAALFAHRIRLAAAALILRSWRVQGVVSVALVLDAATDSRMRVEPVGRRCKSKGERWPVDHPAVPPMLVASIAFGVVYDEIGDPLGTGPSFERAIGELREAFAEVAISAGEVS